jgi:hypothetical protein
MRKLVVLAALAVLAAPANAAAKEISAAKICGPSSCVTSTDKGALMQLMASSAPVSAPPGPAPYLKLTFQVTEPGHGLVGGWDAWFVPSAGILSTRGEFGSPQWSTVDAKTVAFLKTAAATVDPFPAPRFTRVLYGTRPARDPNSYRVLFDSRWPVVFDSASDWKPITIVASAHNPWTDGLQLLYSPKGNVLWRGVDRFRVPSRIAANIEGRRSLAAAAPKPNRAWAWALGAAAVFGLAAAAVVRRRRA